VLWITTNWVRYDGNANVSTWFSVDASNANAASHL
jgi:hypothetical protein